MADDVVSVEHESNRECNEEEKLLKNHKKERKDLQAEIAKLKHSIPKGDKKRKKDMTAQVALLEAQLEEKHIKELAALQTSSNEIVHGIASVSLAAENAQANESNSDVQLKGKKPSKAQRRREKKIEEERARAKNIAQQEIENLTGARNVESVKLKKILLSKGLKIHEYSVQELRNRTADYMRHNMEDFLPFLSKADIRDPYTEDEFEGYCNELQKTHAWGGQLEINALSKILKTPIEVIQADVPSITSGDEFRLLPITLTYHRHMFGLGEHYNAVVARTAEDDDEFS